MNVSKTWQFELYGFGEFLSRSFLSFLYSLRLNNINATMPACAIRRSASTACHTWGTTHRPSPSLRFLSGMCGG
jgi:hypothetical protein